MSEASASENGGGNHLHPCVATFVWWCVWAGCAVAIAAIAHSALWLLLALPTLPTLCILGARIARGYPKTDPEALQRFMGVLAEVGDEIGDDQELAVIVQDQTPGPCELRRGSHPTLVAALGLVQSSSDEVLRGVAALQCASLVNTRMKNRIRVVKAISLLAIAVMAVLVASLAPRGVSPLAAFASIPLTLWLIGALLSAWSTLPAAGFVFVGLDAVAVELAGGAAPVIDALVAMEGWREANRAAQSPLEKAATRCAQPIRPSAFTTSRVTRLRSAQPVAE